ncbi:hypothetical protein IN07_19405 [Modestobacter caceresii]|uniref:Uncharacterized protein n=1 Tax=Modestobacter caceresii TaxID=1522368 RepID=A0A098Y3Q1_9ACTN|nr:hypothetical protein IN07_19405 [Modestobacter caceresii]
MGRQRGQRPQPVDRQAQQHRREQAARAQPQQDQHHPGSRSRQDRQPDTEGDREGTALLADERTAGLDAGTRTATA